MHTLNAFFVAEPNYHYNYSSCTGECDSICRCSRIENFQILSVYRENSPVRIVKTKIGSKPDRWGKNVHTPTVIQEYAIDRLFRIHRVYDTSLWTMDSGNGYYGEEITSVSFDNEDAFMAEVNYMLTLTDELDIIKYVLTREYSFLIDAVEKSSSVEIITMEPETLFHNQDYMVRVKRYEVDDYVMPPKHVPIAVIYRGKNLIDGYHRVGKMMGNGPQLFINIT